MSWDVMIFSARNLPAGIREPPDDWQAESMGEADDVRTAINASMPDVDWSDRAWGLLDGTGWSIEFNFQADGPVDHFMLHVRGGGNPITPIVALCKKNGWAALDTSTAEFID